MKLLEIPEHVGDLRDYNKFINTIVEVQKFNSNISRFLNKVLKDEFYKTVYEWRKTLSESDNLKIDKLFRLKKRNTETIRKLKTQLEQYQHYIEYFQKKMDEGVVIDTNCVPNCNVEEKLKYYEKEERQLIREIVKFEDDPVSSYHVFYCYKTNSFIRPVNSSATRELDWSNYSVKPSNDGSKMILTFKYSYKEHSTPSWLPTYQAKTEYQIDLIEKSVTQIHESITETSNKR